jgi:spore coat protein CotF
MQQPYAAHEVLESMEAMRTKAAEIEQHGFFATQCQDPQLKQILLNHQQRMIQAYQQGIGLLQGKGAAITHQPPMVHGGDYSVGLQQSNQMSTAPNPTPSKLSDNTISTLVLNTHKSGAMMGMVWANECADASLRNYHVQGANLCQEMAYEVFQYMNHRGYYQTPAMQDQQVNTMFNSFQAIDQNQMSSQPTQQMLHNSHYGMNTHTTNTNVQSNTHGTTGFYQ